MKIYGDERSGNCYKLQLACALLDLSYDWVHMDILTGDTRTEEFLALNANGKIPLLELDDGRTLAESNAILNFLARGSHLLPDDDYALAQVQQWQFFEQYSHEPYIAVARFIEKYLGLPEDRKAEYEAKRQGGYKALSVMEEALTERSWFVGDALTIADISLFAYTHVAHEGSFDLSPFSAVQAWLRRMANHPKHIAMRPAKGQL